MAKRKEREEDLEATGAPPAKKPQLCSEPCPMCGCRPDEEDSLKLFPHPRTLEPACVECFFQAFGVIPATVYSCAYQVKLVYKNPPSRGGEETVKFSIFDPANFTRDILPSLKTFLEAWNFATLFTDDRKSNIIRMETSHEQAGDQIWPLREGFIDACLRITHPADWADEMGEELDVEKAFIRDPRIVLFWAEVCRFLRAVTEPSFPNRNYHNDFHPYQSYERVVQYISLAQGLLRLGKEIGVPGFV